MKDFGMGTCRSCGIEFKKKMPHQLSCVKACGRSAKYRLKTPEQKKEFERKKVARSSAKIKVREITKRHFKVAQPCESCGQTGTDRHHDNYNKPLDIRWFCAPCHRAWHKVNKAIAPVEDGMQVLLPV